MRLLASLALSLALSTPALALTPAEIEKAEAGSQDRAAATRIQTLLSRTTASPGIVDGHWGSATEAALKAFQEMKGLDITGKADDATMKALPTDAAVVKRYTITEDDAGMKLYAEIDEGEWKKMAGLEKLGFARHSEALAERFEMAEELLKTLNPDADFSKAGTEIAVIDPGERPKASVTRIEVDKASDALRGYDGSGKLTFFAPAAVGSQQTPSPSGTMSVTNVAENPTYTYDPKDFGSEGETLSIAAGPNGPVGTFWIGLDKPTYGIHGAPDPASLFTQKSHGCVRLTNWDAVTLGFAVEPGETKVEFVGG